MWVGQSGLSCRTAIWRMLRRVRLSRSAGARATRILAGSTLFFSACNAGPNVITSVRDAAPVKDEPAQPTGVGGAPAFTLDAWPSFPDGSYEVGSGAGEKVLVYAHSGSDLFSVDPQTLQFSRVGNFAIREPAPVRFLNDVTDIAVDRDGRIVGTTFNRLLQIDPRSGDCIPI